ncbi:MAG: hypothetical protein HZB68_02600 [Candidatus Aenigmarchaeota archaeon]|nr:hypothetical protein [Candidatus Aenigmarchaeota archaeon]
MEKFNIHKEYRSFCETVDKKEARYAELVSMGIPNSVLAETMKKENLHDILWNGMPSYSSFPLEFSNGSCGSIALTKVDNDTMEIRLYGPQPRLHIENYKALKAEAEEHGLELDADRKAVDMRGYVNSMRHSSYRFKKDGETVIDVLDEGMGFCIQSGMSEKYLSLIGKIIECGK